MTDFSREAGKTYSHLQMLIRYKAWANDIVFGCVLDLPEAEIVKVRKTLFKTIGSTLNHIYVVEDIFKAHLEGRSHNYSARNTPETPRLVELWAKVQVMDHWYIDFADSLSDGDMQKIIEFEFVGGGEGRMSRSDILYHIVNHNTYHRGLVADMLYQVPVKQAANDLPVFLRDVWNAS